MFLLRFYVATWLVIIIYHKSPNPPPLHLYYYYRVGGTSLHLVLGDSVGRAVATSEAVGGGDGRPQRFAAHLHVGPCGHHGSNCEN